MRKKFDFFIYVTIFLLTFSFLWGSAEKKPLSIKEMIGIKSVGSVAISPCGKMVAFEVTSVDWENNTFTKDLWLAYTDGSRCFPVTRGKSNTSPGTFPLESARLSPFNCLQEGTRIASGRKDVPFRM